MRSRIDQFVAYRVDLPMATRHLLLYWSLWLIGCWLLALGTAPQAEAPRLMVLASLVGMLLIWPAFRLSQRRLEQVTMTSEDQLVLQKTQSTFSTQPLASDLAPSAICQEDSVQTVIEQAISTTMPQDTIEDEGSAEFTILSSVLMDWLALVIVFQAVIIPLHLIADWLVVQTLVVNAVLVAWSMVASVFVAWGSLSRSEWTRCLAMLACVMLVAVGPIAMWIGSFFTSRGMPWPESMASGPIGMLWNLAGPAILETQSLGTMLLQAVVLVSGALICWVVLVVGLCFGIRASE